MNPMIFLALSFLIVVPALLVSLARLERWATRSPR
jgi:hypothetical protein